MSSRPLLLSPSQGLCTTGFFDKKAWTQPNSSRVGHVLVKIDILSVSRSLLGTFLHEIKMATDGGAAVYRHRRGFAAVGDVLPHVSSGPKSNADRWLLVDPDIARAAVRDVRSPAERVSKNPYVGAALRTRDATNATAPRASPHHIAVDFGARKTRSAGEDRERAPPAASKRSELLHPSMPLSALSDDGESEDESIEVIPHFPHQRAHGAAENDEMNSSAKDQYGKYQSQWTSFITEAPAIAKHAMLSWDRTDETWELPCYFEIPSRREAKTDARFRSDVVRRAGRCEREAAIQARVAGVERFFWRSGNFVRATLGETVWNVIAEVVKWKDRFIETTILRGPEAKKSWR